MPMVSGNEEAGGEIKGEARSMPHLPRTIHRIEKKKKYGGPVPQLMSKREGIKGEARSMPHLPRTIHRIEKKKKYGGPVPQLMSKREGSDYARVSPLNRHTFKSVTIKGEPFT